MPPRDRFPSDVLDILLAVLFAAGLMHLRRRGRHDLRLAAMTEELIQEAAFRLFQRHIRTTDEWTARRRFERLPQLRREEWEGDAKTVIRIAEVHLS